MRGSRSPVHAFPSIGAQPFPNPCCLRMRQLLLYRKSAGRKSTPWISIPIRAWGRGRPTTPTTNLCGPLADRPRTKARSQPFLPSSASRTRAPPVAARGNDRSRLDSSHADPRASASSNDRREVRPKEEKRVQRVGAEAKGGFKLFLKWIICHMLIPRVRAVHIKPQSLLLFTCFFAHLFSARVFRLLYVHVSRIPREEAVLRKDF